MRFQSSKKKLAQQREKSAATSGEVERAKVEFALLSQAAATAIASSDAAGSDCNPQCFGGTAAVAVKSYLQSLPPAVAADPQGQQAMQQVLALLGRLDDAARAAAQAAPVGHRPPGTEEAVASMVAECRAANSDRTEDATALQAQLSAFKAEADELQKLWADMDQDLASDTESAAPSESGDQGEARHLRKAQKTEARNAKRKKIGEKLTVFSKFGSRGA